MNYKIDEKFRGRKGSLLGKGLNAGQITHEGNYRALWYKHNHKDLTPNEMAKMSGMSRPTVVKTLAKFGLKGKLDDRAPKNKRRVRVTGTYMQDFLGPVERAIPYPMREWVARIEQFRSEAAL